MKTLFDKGFEIMNTPNNYSQLLIYQSPSGEVKIDVRLDNETVWLTQKLMAELFQAFGAKYKYAS